MNKVKTEASPSYGSLENIVNVRHITSIYDFSDDQIIERAKQIVQSRLRTFGFSATDPNHVRDYLAIEFAELEHEVFSCLFLNNQHQLIDKVEMFAGTVDGASVYPREVVKLALQLNANAVIFVHNHPSRLCSPSSADIEITKKLSAALKIVDIRALDHMIVAGTEVYSFAENGMM